ncbi:MAG: methylenetetrahydrofolate reductase C-terminal domain-containing protein [Deltaproteobacteria bacterium]|jgi:ferredoxin|nr:methylenetetrahydrofolate reductase C-terminal domain-containing protein [Deltaproteobacteria bacterium]
MIVSQRKSYEELLLHLEGLHTLFLIGCSACATACKSGGEEEVDRMEEWLVANGRQVTGSAVIDSPCNINRTARDLRDHRAQVDEADAILVMACGAGVHSVALKSGKRVVGALDTLFLGNIRRIGQFEEKCSICGACLLNETGGICPATLCPKGLLNGPCGGMEDGKCETDRELDCAWCMIYDRLKNEGRGGVFTRIVPPRDWQRKLPPGKLTV